MIQASCFFFHRALFFLLAYRDAEAKTIPTEPSRQSVLEHRCEVFKAFEARDVELAQRLIVEHFQGIEKRFKIALENLEQRKEG